MQWWLLILEWISRKLHLFFRTEFHSVIILGQTYQQWKVVQDIFTSFPQNTMYMTYFTLCNIILDFSQNYEGTIAKHFFFCDGVGMMKRRSLSWLSNFSVHLIDENVLFRLI